MYELMDSAAERLDYHNLMTFEQGQWFVSFILLFIVVGILAWSAIFEHYRVAYAHNPTQANRVSMCAAAVAPLAVPLLMGTAVFVWAMRLVRKA